MVLLERFPRVQVGGLLETGHLDDNLQDGSDVSAGSLRFVIVVEHGKRLTQLT
jgi:hypothetical protein